MSEVMGRMEQEAETAERRAAALRKLIEATRELGPERVAELIAAGNRNGHGNGHATRGHATRGNGTDAPSGETAEDAIPRGREAVRLIVAAKPGLWRLADIRAEMKARGWFTSAKAVAVAVTRLCETGEARRTSHKGLYEFPGPATEEADTP